MGLLYAVHQRFNLSAMDVLSLEPARIQPGFTVEQTSWSPLTLSLD